LREGGRTLPFRAVVEPRVLMLAALCGCGRIGFVETGSTGDGSSIDLGPLVESGGVTERSTTFGGAGNEEGYDLAVAGNGTLVMTGVFSGSFAFGTDTVTSIGGDDVFVVALTSELAPIWVRTFGSAAGDRGQQVVVDGNGAIYVCGLYAGATMFGAQMRTPVGMWDVYVISYDASGTQRWVQTFGTAGADFAYGIALAPNGDVLITGYYEGALMIGNDSLAAFGLRDVFVARLDATSGTPLWARGYGSAGSDSGQGVAADAAGNIFMTANLGGPIDFGRGAIGVAGGSALVGLGATGTTTWSNPLNAIVTWAVDVYRPTNTVLLGARNLVGADVGTGTLPPPIGGTSDALVAAFTSDGAVTWHREFGGSLDDLALNIASDAAGNNYSIGLGGADLMFGTDVIPGNGAQDVFVTAYDSAGAPRWARMFGGATQDRGYGVAVAPDGPVYVSGRFAGTADFGSGPVTSAGGDDIFLVKLR